MATLTFAHESAAVSLVMFLSSLHVSVHVYRNSAAMYSPSWCELRCECEPESSLEYRDAMLESNSTSMGIG